MKKKKIPLVPCPRVGDLIVSHRLPTRRREKVQEFLYLVTEVCEPATGGRIPLRCHPKKTESFYKKPEVMWIPSLTDASVGELLTLA